MRYPKGAALGSSMQDTIRKLLISPACILYWTPTRVKLSVTSIASYLPSSTIHDHTTFSGITSQTGRQVFTAVQEADIRKNQAEKQLRDAEHRNLLWAVEDLSDQDADGEDDPEYMQDADEQCIPVGIRNNNGQIEAMPVNEQTVEEHFSGLVERIPKRLHEIVSLTASLSDTSLTTSSRLTRWLKKYQKTFGWTKRSLCCPQLTTMVLR